MNIQQISINDLKPYPQNAKKHPAEQQIGYIANSVYKSKAKAEKQGRAIKASQRKGGV